MTAPLKHKLQSKLQLPRRARIAGGKARIGDSAESRATHHSAGLPEVRMVENVESLRSQLQVSFFVKFDVLEHRDVHVIETRSNNHVATQIAEARDSRKD